MARKDRWPNCDVSATWLLDQDLQGCLVRRARATFSQAKDVDHAFRGASQSLELECCHEKTRLRRLRRRLARFVRPSGAADLPSVKSAPVYAPIDDPFDPFLIRVRALGVLPNGSGSTINGGPIYGAKLTNNVVPEVDFTYFFTKHIAVEMIAAMVHHTLEGSLTPFGPSQNIANTTLLPPTATLQYHFAWGQFDPLWAWAPTTPGSWKPRRR